MVGVVQYAMEKGAVELREVPVPGDPSDDEVLLATRAVGVCGSDVHQYHNTNSWSVAVPVILGHEFCGVVAQTGRSVEGFRDGDRRVDQPASEHDSDDLSATGAADRGTGSVAGACQRPGSAPRRGRIARERIDPGRHGLRRRAVDRQ